MKRTAVNPWKWSLDWGYNQGELVTGGARTLFLAGQTSTDGDGVTQHEGDMAGQLALAIANVEAVLAEAGMTLADVVRLNVFTTDVDRCLQHYGVVRERLDAAGVAPAGTLVGVTRLALPALLVELEATAVA